jgi:hypothetical protein
MSRITERRELEEVRAPEDLSEVGIQRGERGVVVEVFGEPDPAIMVEYADEEGQTRALVIYTPDLGHVLRIMPEQDS